MGPLGILLSPTALVVYAVLGVLGYIHHHGDARGYARHAAEVAEAIRETNKGLARVDSASVAALAKGKAEREVIINEIITAVEIPGPGPVQIINGTCGDPPELLAKLKRIKTGAP